jgi:hypothetical protein
MRFCLGLPEAGRRPLTEPERGRVAALRGRLVGRSVRRALLAGALAAGGVVAGVAAAGAGWYRTAVSVFAGAALALAAALLALRDAARDGRRLAADLRDGTADLFARGSRSLAVLAHTRRVVARDGSPADLGEPALVGAAAPPPEEPPTYAVAADPAGEARALGLVRRALSRDERDEIRGHARRFARIPASLLAATALAGLATGVWLAEEGREAARGSGLLWVVLLGLAWWRAVGARRLAARLRADEHEGWVLRATAGSAAGTEILPASRASWTAHGAPATWRLAARARS